MSAPGSRFEPWTRQFTGAPRVHVAYTVLRGRVVDACPHRHRTAAAAKRCAVGMCKVRNGAAS